MKLHDPEAYTTTTEPEVIRRLLPLAGACVLELGCGRAEMTRVIAEEFPVAEIVATEVDEVQHGKNQTIQDLPKVHFRLGGAEAIPEPDASFDAVFMFKSLHHVPRNLIAPSLREIRRVLRPDGHIWITTPNFMDISSRLAWLFSGQKSWRGGLPNEQSTLWGADGDRVYHGHAFHLAWFQLRYLLRINHFDGFDSWYSHAGAGRGQV